MLTTDLDFQKALFTGFRSWSVRKGDVRSLIGMRVRSDLVTDIGLPLVTDISIVVGIILKMIPNFCDVLIQIFQE